MAPLRDRPLSNSPEPEWPPRPTTPLRIAKREGTTRQHVSQLSRRASNTINRLKSSSLVSQSPFRSQIPTPARPSSVASPSPRRVSGEKRQRPHSMHDQAENEKPSGFKRRQSRGFQGLIQKEPVSKSPFRHSTQSDDPSPPPVPPKASQSSQSSQSSRLPTPSSSGSPARSSLVSKRFHGPRILGHDIGKRQRRKTVTFDERCDVVEFERDSLEMDDDPFMSDDEDDYGQPEPGPFYNEGDGHSDPDDSITGLVDSMLQDARPETPPLDHSLPIDADTEDGVPYGRSHHAERVTTAHQHPPTPPDTSSDGPQPSPQASSPVQEPESQCSPDSHILLGRSAEEQRAYDRSKDVSEEDVDMMPPSPSPVKKGKSSTSGNTDGLIPRFDLDIPRIGSNTKDDDNADPFDVSEDVQVVELSFLSSSDVQAELDASNRSIGQSDISLGGLEAELGVTRDYRRSSVHTSTPPLKLKSSGLSLQRSMDSLNSRELPIPPRSRSNSPFILSEVSRASPSAPRPISPTAATSADIFATASRVVSPSALSPRVMSPLQQELHSASSSTSLSGSGSRGPRINRDDVHKKLLRKRSTESPVSSDDRTAPTFLEKDAEDGTGPEAADITSEIKVEDIVQPRPSNLRREDNYTYDGVMAIDPEPQPMDPPRPTTLARAFSADDAHDSAASTSFQGLKFDLSSVTAFDLGLKSVDFSNSSRVDLGDMKSGLDKLVENVTVDAASPRDSRALRMQTSHGSLRIEAVTQGVKARQFERPANLDVTMEESEGEEISEDRDESMSEEPRSASPASPDVLLHGNNFKSPPISQNTSSSSIPPPPPPPKEAIKNREQLILEKRRELRRREDDEAMGRRTPPRSVEQERATRYGARPTRRRSRSTGDTGGGDETDRMQLDNKAAMPKTNDLERSISKELKKRVVKNNKYQIREHETIYASSDADKVSHMGSAGDVDSGRAWRTVRRPSDMNEYAKEIREYRAQERPGKAHGKVFVRVTEVKGLKLPMPQQETILTCTLNNGIHFVTTPECRLAKDCRIDQEFELIEHSKLEFTMTLKIRRDPHIVAQFKANAPPPPPPPQPVAPPPASKGGMRSFFSSSPKKAYKVTVQPPPPPPVHRLEENLARYLKPDGTLARAFVSFKDIASHCDTRLFRTTFPLIGQRLENGNKANPLQIGELVIEFFRLPPLPGIPSNQLPQSLEECHRGLRHVYWHKHTYFEGTLTQNGADCTTWRRRQFRVIGANLVAFNDVTKRATATIDLRKAITVEDLQDPGARLLSPSSSRAARSIYDEYEYGVERSFRLIFQRDQEIIFFADTDEEKSRWLEVLRSLVGRIPPNPLWAELLWQRQQELAKQSAPSSGKVEGPSGSRS
ncbi:hypothetical protein OF83DRAFT_421696 [Amylostereum chailletii]|nr:hypothetical protein OF83DRAFT_421696 [Amylostereum chailletii]